MIVFEKPHALTDTVLHYCPGCTHGIVHRLVAEAIDELGIEGKTVGIAPVGCSVLAYNYFNCDMIEAAHGRAPAVATGVKRALPDNIVFAYQGDGDLASIGMCETVSTAARGENITIIFINNAIYGMTGGQMAVTPRPRATPSASASCWRPLMLPSTSSASPSTTSRTSATPSAPSRRPSRTRSTARASPSSKSSPPAPPTGA